MCLSARGWQATVSLCLAFMAVASSRAAAQAQAPVSAPESARWEIGPYIGVARHSPVGRHLGVTPDRDHLFIGVHATARLIKRRAWALRYAPEVVPLLVISNNPRYDVFIEPDGRRFMFTTGEGPVLGIGVSPIGLETDVTITPRWRLYAAGAAGAIWFTRDVPVAYSRQFNYTFEVGGGVQWQFAPHYWLRGGYKFHHLSNAFTAYQNPGIDGMVWLLGVTRTIGR
jgi:lipid A 3-O-deacylase PagL